ncbi:MAG: FHA domain-containing protein [bacterium]|nr:FHA domain-containing protein [bacterium]
MSKIKLIILAGPYEGNSYEFEYDITIGRDISNDLALPLDLTISRKHAKLNIINNNIYITDLGSTNGTFIITKNKLEKLKPNIETNIPKSSIIKIGNTVILLN